jgi:uncharacterized protein (TIGR00369 family)
MTDQAAAMAQAFKQFSDSTVAGALGIEFRECTADGITLAMTISNASRQPMGLLHGGVSMVLAETAASLHSCWGLDLTRFYPVGIEINGSHMRSASAGVVLAKATVVRRSRTLIVHQIDIIHEESGEQLCSSRVTNLIREHRNPVPPAADL